jgi:hypothetical protein
MDHRPWLERVEGELARRGVPARWRRRLLAELRDHLADLTEEGARMTTDQMTLAAQLGPPEQVAATAAEEYRKAGWVRRHPLLVFGLMPVPALVLGFAGTMLFFELVVAAAAIAAGVSLDDPPRSVAVPLAYTVHFASRILAFVLLMAVFTRLYLRSGVRWGWYAAAAGQILFLAATFFSVLTIRDEPGQSTLMFGLAFLPVPNSTLRQIGWSQVAQFAAPLIVGWLMVRAARRRVVPAVA